MGKLSKDAQAILTTLQAVQRMSEYDLEKELVDGDPDRLYDALDELDPYGYIHWEDGEVVLLKAGVEGAE